MPGQKQLKGDKNIVLIWLPFVECLECQEKIRHSTNHNQINSRHSTNHNQINSRHSTNHNQLNSRHSTNHNQVNSRHSTNHSQLNYRHSTNHIQINYRHSTNHIQINYRHSTNHNPVNAIFSLSLFNCCFVDLKRAFTPKNVPVLYCPNSVIQPLQKVLNFAVSVRLILLAPHHHRSTPLLEKLHWLPISECIKI